MRNHSIGHTPLKTIPALNEAFNIKNLQIKDESANPTGTWKDRRSANIIRHLNNRPEPHICLVTAGNAALSIAKLTKDLHFRITALVSEDICPDIAMEMEKQGIHVLPARLDRQLYSEEIAKLAKDNNNGDDHPIDVTHFMHTAYTTIIHELSAEDPDYIIAPFGTGEGLFGLCMENYRSQIHSPHHTAKIIGVKSAVPGSLADKVTRLISPYHEMLKEYHQAGQIDITVSEKEIDQVYEQVSPHLQVEPSSAAAFAALSHLPLKSTDKVVIINSGRGIS